MVTGTPQPSSAARPRAMAALFPRAGRRLEHAFRELDLALHGNAEQKKALGNPRLLARPWDPPTCADPQLRAELWDWLDHVVAWLNSEYVWQVTGMIPACWPRHPHLVHEISVLADLRRRAGHALTSDALEEWHRYALPAFTERMRQRMGSHCEDRDHQPWPAVGRQTRYISPESIAERDTIFHSDVATLLPPEPAPSPPTGRHLQLVDGMTIDPASGEVIDDA